VKSFLLALSSAAILFLPVALGQLSSKTSEIPVGLAFAPVPIISAQQLKNFLFESSADRPAVAKLCADLGETFRAIWLGTRSMRIRSVAGRPEIRQRQTADLRRMSGSGEETTLLLGRVHPDEMTPIPIAFRFARLLQTRNSTENRGIHVVIAPIVDPDGFLRIKGNPKAMPTRSQGQFGVDLNRNFFTADWYPKAKHWWEERRQKSSSHFPGYFPILKLRLVPIQLIDEVNPDNSSIHAPLGFLDYDGPESRCPAP
jgi:protein MpaA